MEFFLLCNCRFICEIAKKPKRIPEEKVFVTKELFKGVTTSTITKVLQRDHRKFIDKLKKPSRFKNLSLVTCYKVFREIATIQNQRQGHLLTKGTSLKV